ncbi:GDSL-type esterase/lipase family protein [Phocaeicola sp.]
MKRVILVLLGCLLALPQFAQERKYSTFYEQRATLFEELPTSPKDIVFLGNSITNGCEWSELLQNKNVKNRGISGDICMGVYDRLEPIVKGKPAKIFLLIGINDVSRGTSADTIVSRIEMIVQKIKRESPKTKLYLQSVLPVNECYGMFGGHTSRWQVVKQINDLLKPLAEKEHAKYVDLYSRFVDGDTGKMNPAYTNDGLHLLGKGYLLWRDIVEPYVNEK